MKVDMKSLVKANPDWFLYQLKKVKAFSVLSDAELLKISEQMRSFDFKAGTTLVNQGESANLFFIVREGSVEVSVKKFFFREKRVAVLESGDYFGESVLVSDSKRTATVTALTDTTCFVLLKPSFKSVLNQNALSKANMKVVFARRKTQLNNA